MADNLDFLNLNSLRAYPVRELCTRTDQTGLFTIPDNFIVDMILSISSDPTIRVYISRIQNLVGGFMVVELTDNNNIIIGTFTINPSTFTENQVYYLSATPTYNGANGKLVIGSLTTISTLPAGIFIFELSTTEIETRVIIPSVVGATSFTFNDSLGNTYTATGDIILQGRVNMALTYNSMTNTITFDAGNGLGLNQVCQDTIPCIQTINGISPNSQGDFIFQFSGCSSVSTVSNGLLVNDDCAKACAGCSDLELLTGQLNNLESTILQYQTQYSTLLSAFNTYQARSATCT